MGEMQNGIASLERHSKSFLEIWTYIWSYNQIPWYLLQCIENWCPHHEAYILSSCLFNLCAEYIMWNAGLDESQARIIIAGRNINNHRYADDTPLMAESKDKLKTLLISVKEESEKAGFKIKIQKTKIMASDLITSQQIENWK